MLKQFHRAFSKGLVRIRKPIAERSGRNTRALDDTLASRCLRYNIMCMIDRITFQGEKRFNFLSMFVNVGNLSALYRERLWYCQRFIIISFPLPRLGFGPTENRRRPQES